LGIIFCDNVLLMSKKSFFVILVLSVVITVGIPFIYFENNGFPLQFTSFNLLGSETNYLNLIFDIVFWFVIIWGVWKLITKISKR